jgi:hypothetical protein
MEAVDGDQVSEAVLCAEDVPGAAGRAEADGGNKDQWEGAEPDPEEAAAGGVSEEKGRGLGQAGGAVTLRLNRAGDPRYPDGEKMVRVVWNGQIVKVWEGHHLQPSLHFGFEGEE